MLSEMILNARISILIIGNLLCATSSATNTRYIMYLTGQHYVVPEPNLVSNITHVALAFMQSSVFNTPGLYDWPLFTTVEAVRSQFPQNTAILVAIGGWGDTQGFSEAAASETSRRLFARNLKAMVEHTGADGVDVDWEYPGGNAEDYKRVPNIGKRWEIEAYPKLLSEIRHALGPEKLMSAAVPGLARDMVAFNNETISQISASLDFFNVMAYDLMNRRDHVTKHHTGIDLSMEAVNNYLEIGIPSEKLHLGFAFYVKWFRTSPHGGCNIDPIGCETDLMEDPVTGTDLGRSGAFAWSDTVPSDLSASFDRALMGGQYDSKSGGHYFWDSDENIWWTWDTPEAIANKFPAIVEKKRLGGVFAWGLGEDSASWTHLKALTAEIQRISSGAKTDDEDTEYLTRNVQSQRATNLPGSQPKDEL